MALEFIDGFRLLASRPGLGHTREDLVGRVRVHLQVFDDFTVIVPYSLPVRLCLPAAVVYNRSLQAVVAQMVERVLGKDEVTGSIPVNGSRNQPRSYRPPHSFSGRYLIAMKTSWHPVSKGFHYGEREI
jgi:hypothetical protein